MSIYSKVTEYSNPQLNISIMPDGLYILTGHGVISCFRSAANRIKVFVFVMFWSLFLDNGSTDFEKLYSFGTGVVSE